MYTAVFGVFSFCWFGWAQESPRNSWRKYIGIASGIALIVGLIGIYLSITNWQEGSALSDSIAFKGYLIFVYRSEEHTSELQSRGHLVCRLLLEKKKNNKTTNKNQINQNTEDMKPSQTRTDTKTEKHMNETAIK